MITFNWIHFNVLLGGLMWTVGLSVIAFACGGLVGFFVALGRTARSPLIAIPVSWYVQFVQGTPLLILLFALYFGMPLVGVDMPPLLAAAVGLTMFSSAFLGEIWRGCLQSVPRQQWEAADCLALNYWQRMFLVILPQAARIAIPPTVGFMVQIVKNTSLVSVIGMAEVTYIGKQVNAATFQPFITYFVIGAMYFVICYPLSWWSHKLEKKLNVANR
jgi:polar amino acid transport system permease protein